MTTSTSSPTSFHELAAALRSRCDFAFSDDPHTEVGKVIASTDRCVFFVYVMKGEFNGRSIERSNVVITSGAGVEVLGPDEQTIGLVLKQPLL